MFLLAKHHSTVGHYFYPCAQNYVLVLALMSQPWACIPSSITDFCALENSVLVSVLYFLMGQQYFLLQPFKVFRQEEPLKQCFASKTARLSDKGETQKSLCYFLNLFLFGKIKLPLLYSLQQQNFDTCFKPESSYSNENQTQTNNPLGFLWGFVFWFWFLFPP